MTLEREEIIQTVPTARSVETYSGPNDIHTDDKHLKIVKTAQDLECLQRSIEGRTESTHSRQSNEPKFTLN